MNKFRGQKRARILGNPSVLRMTASHVVFTSEFIRGSLSKKADGISPNQIFSEAGFEAKDFKPRYFVLTMRRWRDQEKKLMDGSGGSLKRGRPKGSKKDFDTLENLNPDDLRSIILVQEEMIKQLKKKKALPKKK